MKAEVIVWDEEISMHKDAIETVDQSLMDLMKVNEPFGGKVVVFAGDFRQTLPVVKEGVYPWSENATLKLSYLWNTISKFTLIDNLRLGLDGHGSFNALNVAFGAKFLLIGEGKTQTLDVERINLKETVVKSYCNGIQFHAAAMN
jgi:hypothetical protein